MKNSYEVSIKVSPIKNFSWIFNEVESMYIWHSTKIYSEEAVVDFVFTIVVDGDNSIHQQTEIINRKVSRLGVYLEGKYRLNILSTTKKMV